MDDSTGADDRVDVLEKQVIELEHRAPLPGCQQMFSHLNKNLFGNGNPADSVVFRLAQVECVIRKMSRVIWGVAFGVGGMIIHLFYDWIRAAGP